MSGAALTALAGSLYAHYMSFVGPDYMLASETFWLWTMLMIGGLGNTAGVLVGVVVVQGAYAAGAVRQGLLRLQLRHLGRAASGSDWFYLAGQPDVAQPGPGA